MRVGDDGCGEVVENGSRSGPLLWFPVSRI